MKNFKPEASTDIIEKFINSMMWDGKKHLSRAILEDCVEDIKKSGHKDPKNVFEW